MAEHCDASAWTQLLRGGCELFVEAKATRQGLVVAAQTLFRRQRQIVKAAVGDWDRNAAVRAGSEQEPLAARGEHLQPIRVQAVRLHGAR